jgi:hypothetical protein
MQVQWTPDGLASGTAQWSQSHTLWPNTTTTRQIDADAAVQIALGTLRDTAAAAGVTSMHQDDFTKVYGEDAPRVWYTTAGSDIGEQEVDQNKAPQPILAVLNAAKAAQDAIAAHN